MTYGSAIHKKGPSVTDVAREPHVSLNICIQQKLCGWTPISYKC